MSIFISCGPQLPESFEDLSNYISGPGLAILLSLSPLDLGAFPGSPSIVVRVGL